MKDVLIIIQARMGSTRLPGKILMELGGKTVLEKVKDTCNSVTETIIATPESVPKVSENDVLARYYITAKLNPVKHIVRITADCPLISADLIRIAIAAHKSHNAEYTCFDKIVSGLDVEVFTREALEKAHQSATEPYDREHVTPWMKRTLQIHRIKKLSLDTQEDLDYLRRIEDALH